MPPHLMTHLTTKMHNVKSGFTQLRTEFLFLIFFIFNLMNRSKVPKVLRNIIYKEETPAPMTFSCNIEMKTKILDVASPSHSIISTKEDDGYKAVVKYVIQGFI